MMRSATNRQRGMSGSGWFMTIVLVFGAASIALRLVPHYLQHGTVDGQILSLLDNPDLAGMNSRQVHRRLESMLKLNNIRDFEIEDKLEIERSAGNVKMDLVYEIREHLFWNVDVILTFEEHYEKVL